MSETYGRVVVQATAEILNAFYVNRDEGLAKLVAYSGAEHAINDECDVFFDELTIKKDSGYFIFENHYWIETVERLAATGSQIGLYVHIWDDDGEQLFLAKNIKGEQYSFLFNSQHAEEENEDMINQQQFISWLNVIPNVIKQDFPELVAIAVRE